MTKNTCLFILLLALLMPTVSSAETCSDSNWDSANRTAASAAKKHKQGNEYFSDANQSCNDDPDDYWLVSKRFGFAEQELARLTSNQARMTQSAEYFQEALRLYDKGIDKWYALYHSCDGDNSDTAWESHEQLDNIRRAAAKSATKSRTCASQLGKMKEIMLERQSKLSN